MSNNWHTQLNCLPVVTVAFMTLLIHRSIQPRLDKTTQILLSFIRHSMVRTQKNTSKQCKQKLQHLSFNVPGKQYLALKILMCSKAHGCSNSNCSQLTHHIDSKHAFVPAETCKRKELTSLKHMPLWSSGPLFASYSQLSLLKDGSLDKLIIQMHLLKIGRAHV